MDLFNQVVYNFPALPCMDSWEEAQTLFQEAASRKPDHWLIPERTCEAVGGVQKQAIPAILSIGCAHVGLLLVDDMLDADPRGDYHRLGMPAVSNLSYAFQAAAMYAINQSIQEPSARIAALGTLNEMFLNTSFGQFLDVRSSENESGYWQVVKAKSSPFFGTAFQMGALAGGGTLKSAEQLKNLGHLYGEMVQIHDDMHDSMESPANPDWLQKRSPLPILFASLVDHPDQARFIELRKHVINYASLEEAQEILIRCGAISYCADQIIRKHQKAKKLLSHIPLVDHRPVISLLDEVIAPVHKLMDICGI